MQNLVPRALGIRRLAGAELLQDLLHGGGRVPRLHVRGHGAQDVVLLAEGLDLKAQLAQELPVSLDELPLLLREAERHALEQGLGHDAAPLRLEAVEDHALMGGVLVDQNQLVPDLDQDVQLQRLTHYLVVRHLDLFHILNRVFHSFGRRNGSKPCVFSRFRVFGGGRAHIREIHAGLVGLRVGAEHLPRPVFFWRSGRGRTAHAVAPVAEVRGAHAAVEVRPRGGSRRRRGGCGAGGGRGGPRSARRRCGLCGGDAGAVLVRQRGQHRVVHQVEDPLFLRELDLRLRRVDVHVDGGVGELEIDHAGREAPDQQGVLIGLLHRRLQKLRADKAPVAEEVLGGAVAAARRGGGHEARDGHIPVLQRDGQQILRHLAPQQGVDAGLRLPVAGGKELLLPVADEAHGDLRSAEGAAQRRLHAGGGLGPVGFQKLKPRRGVEENALHGHDRALRAAGLGHVLDVASGQGDVGAAVVPAAAGGELHLAHGGDGGQRLAAKAHGADGLEPGLIVQLGGSVPQKGDARVLRRHAAAVVADADIGGPAVAQLHRHGVGARVEGVLHQLLDDGGGPLDHLAGGDHVRHMGG